MKLSVIDPPAQEPITLAEAKLYLRVDHSDEDARIAAMLTAARQWVEQVTRRALVTQTLEVWYPAFGRRMELPRPPLQYVESVSYTAPDGTDGTATGFRELAPTESVGSIEAPVTGWPATLCTDDAVRIRYVAGYADPGSPTAGIGGVPEGIRQAILFVLGDFYEHREARTDFETYHNPTAMALLAAYKDWTA